MDWHALDLYCKDLVKEAGQRIRNSFMTDITVESKAHANDLVTNIDKEIEQFFIARIRKDFPDHRIFGEEGFGDSIEELSGMIWMLDPIDGTMNFIHQKRNFAISLGVYEDGIGKLGYIYDVVHGDLYNAIDGHGAYYNDERLQPLPPTTLDESIIAMNAFWATPNRRVDHEGTIALIQRVRGVRSYGSAALELAYVATRRVDAYISMRLNPWDIAGGLVIAKEVGAIAGNFKGEPANLLEQDTFVAANPAIHEEICSHYLKLK
ncbi:inositol monophosphatase family protein [Planomicrobium sp. YIM 101495]|uniref:inositol monophosphatase family protein n=1 Tax=Planomicrobium sp. YIM 101495 TaxID=2665160 RepID=UPI0012B99B9E|nr:inositol monophosphatase family protein [Planomicrobium sp. YIM 101495]MTD30371.1 inositol monophosphatase [Planomicrobium sp. YIM 101495]